MTSSKKAAKLEAAEKYLSTLEAVLGLIPQQFVSETPWTGYMAVKKETPEESVLRPSAVGIGKRKIVWIDPLVPNEVTTIFLGKNTKLVQRDVRSQFGSRGMAITYEITSLTSRSSAKDEHQRPVVSTTTLFQDSHKRKTPPQAIAINYILNNWLDAKEIIEDDPELVALLTDTDAEQVGSVASEMERLIKEDANGFLGWRTDDEPIKILNISVSHLINVFDVILSGDIPPYEVLTKICVASHLGFSWLAHVGFLANRTRPLSDCTGEIVSSLSELDEARLHRNLELARRMTAEIVKAGELTSD